MIYLPKTSKYLQRTTTSFKSFSLSFSVILQTMLDVREHQIEKLNDLFG